MKILVFGAGALGCNLAKNLFRSGKDVTLLARGKWAEEIGKNGLRIKNVLFPRTSVSRVPVTTELGPDDIYDVIFVAVRYTQAEAVADILRENKTKNIVFVGNNVRAKALAASLPEKTFSLLSPFRPDTASMTGWRRSTSKKSPSANFRVHLPMRN